MKKNVGCIDRMMRFIIGAVLLGLFFTLEGSARYLGLFGIIAILTALMNFCPLYSVLGINTGGKSNKGSCCGGGSCGTDESAEDNAKAKDKDSK